jgi:hypothetical protein
MNTLAGLLGLLLIIAAIEDKHGAARSLGFLAIGSLFVLIAMVYEVPQ